MKGMKGKLLKKLKTFKVIGHLKPEKILQVNALDGNLYTTPPKSNSPGRPALVQIQEQLKKCVEINVPDEEPEIIDVSELMKDLEDQEMEFDDEMNDKENVRPENPELVHSSNEFGGERKHIPLLEIDVSFFRQPDLDSGTLFDPNILASFEQAVTGVKSQEAERKKRGILDDQEPLPPLKARKVEEEADSLLEFEDKCPPGGTDSVILYTTGLRGIRKTFEDCHRIRSLLENLRILFCERDVSMHKEFKEELWRILGGKVVPPRLFIKGMYIGGAEEVLGLHEKGKFKPLFEGIAIDRSEGPCEGCAGIRFIVCFNCNGSRKIVLQGNEESINCSDCNENGVVICPFCC
ncbi:Glutaredoxin family protein [Forsythia ovata]|uniref:Glutaredoxin family protein n=1 Tax=Forsythia ovata TaxID=205694 RepID=A0ABD1WI50_9LAMI